MLSFEFSVFDLVLSVSVMVLIVLFVTTLLKLNPSNENKQSRDKEVLEQEQEIALPPQEPAAPISWQSTEGTISQRTQQTPRMLVSATVEGASHESLEHMPKLNVDKEPYKQPKTTASTKQVSKSSDAKDCLHHFGYLNELPKNTPIPGECFGCPKIVDCLVTRKGK